ARRNARGRSDRTHRGLLVRLFLGRVQGRLGFRRPHSGPGFLSDRAARPAGGRESLMTAASGLAVDDATRPLIAWPALLKDALLAGFVAVFLALPLVGLQTYDIGGGALGIRTHFDWVGFAALGVCAGRLALRLARRIYPWRQRQGVPLAHI